MCCCVGEPFLKRGGVSLVWWQNARQKSAELCKKINKAHDILSRHGTHPPSKSGCFSSDADVGVVPAVIGIYNKEIEDAVRGLQPLYEEAIKASVDEERCEDNFASSFALSQQNPARRPNSAPAILFQDGE